jgi:hypothetical protein
VKAAQEEGLGECHGQSCEEQPAECFLVGYRRHNQDHKRKDLQDGEDILDGRTSKYNVSSLFRTGN